MSCSSFAKKLLRGTSVSTIAVVRRYFSVRKLWLPATVSLYALLVFSTVFGDRGVLHLQSLSAEQEGIEAQVFILLRQNEALRECIARLKTDDSFLERIVREEIGFVRPGEIVYRFQAASSASSHWERTCITRFPQARRQAAGRSTLP